MFRISIEWWANLDPKIRITIPVILLIISTVLFFIGILWIWGWVVGVILILFGGRSKAEKSGYRF